MELPEELVGIEDELDMADEPEPEVPGTETDDDGERQEDEPERQKFVLLSVGDAEFALHVNAVQRLVDVTEQTRVPRTSESIDGITDLRGAITAVIDPRTLFDLPPSDGEVETEELVVFSTGQGEGHAGIRVDEVLGVEPIPVTHVILDAEEVDADRETVSSLLDDPLVAGLLREDGDGQHEYRQVVDADAVLDAASEASV